MKIFTYLSRNELKGFLFERLTSPLQLNRFYEFYSDLKECFVKEQDKAKAVIKALDLLMEIKKYPKDYEEIFIILDEILKIYEEDSRVKANLKELLS